MFILGIPEHAGADGLMQIHNSSMVLTAICLSMTSTADAQEPDPATRPTHLPPMQRTIDHAELRFVKFATGRTAVLPLETSGPWTCVQIVDGGSEDGQRRWIPTAHLQTATTASDPARFGADPSYASHGRVWMLIGAAIPFMSVTAWVVFLIARKPKSPTRRPPPLRK